MKTYEVIFTDTSRKKVRIKAKSEIEAILAASANYIEKDLSESVEGAIHEIYMEANLVESDNCSKFEF